MNTAHAELVKLLTLPAVRLSVGLTWAVTALLALITGGEPDPVPYARAGFLVLGVLAAGSEHDGGQLRTSLLCTPRRAELQLIKAAVLALVTLPVAVVTVLVAGAGAATAAYLVLTTVLAAGVATVLRHSTAAVVVVLGYYYVLGPFVRDHFTDGLWLPAVWTIAAVLAATVAIVRGDA